MNNQFWPILVILSNSGKFWWSGNFSIHLGNSGNSGNSEANSTVVHSNSGNSDNSDNYSVVTNSDNSWNTDDSKKICKRTFFSYAFLDMLKR
jgi:hypothetical protein